MKYFGIIDKNVAAIFQLKRKIRNISDMFLQYLYYVGYDAFKPIVRSVTTPDIFLYNSAHANSHKIT